MNIIKRFIKFLIELFKKLFRRKKKVPEEIKLPPVIQELENHSSILSSCKFSEEQDETNSSEPKYRYDHIEIFNSISELLSTLQRRQNNGVMASSHASEENDNSFTRTRSFKEAIELLVNGYSDILGKVKKNYNINTNVLKQEYVRIKSKNVNSVFGGYANVPRALMGLPKDLCNRKVVVNKVKVITVFYCLTTDAFTDTSSIMRAGISVLSAINLLEISGVQVKLFSVFYTGREVSIMKNCKEVVLGAVKLKDYSDRINLLKMCFPLAHPSMLRRIGLKFLETIPNLKLCSFRFGYGSVCSLSDIKCTIKNVAPTYSNSVILDFKTISNLNYSVKQIINYIKTNSNVKE